MAHFRGTIKGGRGLVAKLGTKTSGLNASVCGWLSGVQVIASHENGEDIFTVNILVSDAPQKVGAGDENPSMRIVKTLNIKNGGAIG